MISPRHPFYLRASLYRHLRDFFTQRHYLEIETPMAVVCPGTEVHLEYFSTQWRDYKGVPHPLWLRSSPELHMKQALSLGFPKIFQIARCFRNAGELSPWHNPEFTMLEWYRTGDDFKGFIQETLDLIREVGRGFHGDFPDLKPSGKEPTYTWLTLEEAFWQFAGIKLLDGDPDLAQIAHKKGFVSLRGDEDFETAFFKILLSEIEPKLKDLKRVVLYDYPPSQAALARVEGGSAKRFEIYWDGVELCNGFWELTDPILNRERVKDANRQRQALGKEVPPEDEAFYRCLDRGLPPSCGNALGVDRLLALLAGMDSLALPLWGRPDDDSGDGCV
jgi:lysyl-tRNA synthetase class 2